MDTTAQLDVGCSRWLNPVSAGRNTRGGENREPPPPVSSKRKSLYSVLPDFRIQHSQCQPLGLFSLSTANP